MWGFQLRLSSIITPKNFVWSTLSNCKLFICTFRSGRIMSENIGKFNVGSSN